MSSTQLDHRRVDSDFENYAGFWQNDLKKEAQVDSDNRLDNYTDLVNGYYNNVTDLYEYAWGQSFHFSRFYKGETFSASLARHEHYLASQMRLRPGMRVLDIGCGVGGPAREMARFSDVNVIGLNINDFQLDRARRYTKAAGLEKQVQFVKGDFMRLSEVFGENVFDAVYAIESTPHAPSWEGVYGEALKVLKPGGVFGVYEYGMTERWDPSIPEHKTLAHEIELGGGIPEMRPVHKIRDALKTVGFQIEHEEDLAERPDDIPWYYRLEGDITRSQSTWDYLIAWQMTWSGKLVSYSFLRALGFLRVIPQDSWKISATLRIAGDAMAECGKKKLFTPMYLAVSRKPPQVATSA